jgi:two-component system, OmpR family, phosphate regulon response regulator PhoB
MAHILIVEDDTHTARLIEIRLKQFGHTSAWAQDGIAGIAAARELIPDLILLDYMLPGMSGVDVAKKLKHDLVTRRIPVIMLTARSEGAAVLAGLDAGADAYLIKPVHFPDLIRRIANFIGHNTQIS